MNEQFIIPYLNPDFFDKLAGDAEGLEQSWYYVLYKLANPDSTESKQQVLNQKAKVWKKELKDFLMYGSISPSIQNATNITEIQNCMGACLTDFLTENGVQILSNSINKKLSELYNLEITNKEYNNIKKYGAGLEKEMLIAAKRYAWGKNMDPQVTFKETEGMGLKMEMRADFLVGIPNKHFKSQVNIPFEVKTSLNKFHVTGSKTTYGNILSSMIKNAHVKNSKSNGKLTLQLKKKDFQDVALILLERKFQGVVKSSPVYEDGRQTVLPDEMFRKFGKNGLSLWYESDANMQQIILDGTDFQDKDNDVDAIKKEIAKKIASNKSRFNLWYGKSA